MTDPQGLGSPFQLLFSDGPGGEPSLSEAFRRCYPGDWHVPPIPSRAYVYSNFALSRDGRTKYLMAKLTLGNAAAIHTADPFRIVFRLSGLANRPFVGADSS